MQTLKDQYSSPSASDYSLDSSRRRFRLAMEDVGSRDSLLDYGCGPGNLVEWMLENQRLVAKYCGYDLREETIAYAQKKYTTLSQVEFTSQSPVKDYDWVLMLGTISYLYGDLEQCKAEARDTIVKAWARADTGIVITLPKASHIWTKPMITYEDPVKELSLQVWNDYVLDDKSMDHEYILTVYR